MTTQRTDTLILDNVEYDIILCSNCLGFDIEDYGLNLEWVSTDCWEGHWERYDVDEKGLKLMDIFVNTKDNRYPYINGVKPRSFIILAILSLFKRIDLNNEDLFYHIYHDVNLDLNFSGKIILGKGWIPFWMGYMISETVFVYECILEVEFIEGKLIKIEDVTPIVNLLRKNTNGELEDDENWSIILYNIINYLSNNEDASNWWIEAYRRR